MQWSKEKAWEWYNSYPWLRGCNFIGSDCANRRDMWQSYKSEEHLKTADRELALAKETGFNAVRVIVDFDVWYQEPESFMDIFEKYIQLFDKHGQYAMICLTAECEMPNGDFNNFKPHPLGEQEYALGYHQGRSPEVLKRNMESVDKYHPLESPVLRDKFLQMIRDIVTKYKDDKRIICWNVYNEAGIAMRDRSLPLLKTMFEEVRALEPSQPLTAEMWSGYTDGGECRMEVQTYAMENSDVISFHCYSPLPEMCRQIAYMRKKYGRPILCTEWLNRIMDCSIQDIFPLFALERIGSFCWGFVVGKTQTNEPWYHMFNDYYTGKNRDVDFTKWFHDLYRPSLLPYDPREIELIKSVCALSDKLDAN